MEMKVLVAIDGSSYSLSSLDYLIGFFGPADHLSVHLLSIVSTSGIDQNWMYDVDPLREHPPAVERKIARASKYLKEAQARLTRNGFREEQVSRAAEMSSADVATAIHHEANSGIYDGLLIGRRGVGMVGEMFFGSVSQYLVEKCHEVPLWIVDGAIQSKRFLMTVHGMPQSLMAADHLGYAIHAVPDTHIYLYHSYTLFGSKPKIDREEFHKQWGKEWCDKHLDHENHLFEAHKQILMDHHVPEDRITILPSHTDIEVSHDLLRQAKQAQCGTIVIGRRGRDIEKGFLGGVSDRTMKRAENIAVWLVG